MLVRRKMVTSTALLVLVGATAVNAQNAPIAGPDLPPNAVPGHCYGKMLMPERYETYSEQVLDTAARTEYRVIAAVSGEQEQRVLATEARVEYETLPATYKTVTETVVVKAATTRRETVPAVYATE